MPGEDFLSSIAILSENFKYSHNDNCLIKWLKVLEDFLSNNKVYNVNFQNLMRCNPGIVDDYIFSIIPHFICFNQNSKIYDKCEEFLCDILQGYIDSRRLLRFLLCLLQGIEKVLLCSEKILLKHLFDDSLLPLRFMKMLLCNISTMNVHHLIAMLKQFLVSEVNSTFKQNKTKNFDIHHSTVLFWLSSCILSVSSLKTAVSVPSLFEDVVKIMKDIVFCYISPGFEMLLTLPHDNLYCASVLVLCHSWGDVHMQLIEANDKYLNCLELPLATRSDDQIFDFSYLYSYISSDSWAHLTTRIANFGDDTDYSILVQLQIQKLTNEIKILEKKSTSSSEIKSSPIVKASISNLLTMLEGKGNTVVEKNVFHLFYLVEYLSEDFCQFLSLFMTKRLMENSSLFTQYAKSIQFQEQYTFQYFYLQAVVTSLGKVFSYKNRKMDNKTKGSKNCSFYLRKIMSSSKFLMNKNITASTVCDELHRYGRLVTLKYESAALIEVNDGSDHKLKSVLSLLKYLPLRFLNVGYQTVILLILLVILSETAVTEKEIVSLLLELILETLHSSHSVKIFSVIDFKVFLKWIIVQRIKLDNGKFNASDSKFLNNIDKFYCFVVNVYISDSKKIKTINAILELLVNEAVVQPHIYLPFIMPFLFASKYSVAPSKVSKTCWLFSKKLRKPIRNYIRSTSLENFSSCFILSYFHYYQYIIEVNYAKLKELNLVTEKCDTLWKKILRFWPVTNELIELALKQNDIFILVSVINLLHVLSDITPLYLTSISLPFKTVFLKICERPELLDNKFCIENNIEVMFSKIGLLFQKIDEADILDIISTKLKSMHNVNNFSKNLMSWQILIRCISRKSNYFFSSVLTSLISLLAGFLNSTLPIEDFLAIFYTFKSILKYFGSVSDASVTTIISAVSRVIPKEKLNFEDFIKKFTAISEVLQLLISRTEKALLCQLPILLYTYSKMFSLLILHSSLSSKYNEEDINKLIAMCSLISKMSRQLSQHKEESSKILHFTIATFVIVMQKSAIYFPIKNILESNICQLMHICSDQSLKHLLITLPPSEQAYLQYLHTIYMDSYFYSSSSV